MKMQIGISVGKVGAGVRATVSSALAAALLVVFWSASAAHAQHAGAFSRIGFGARGLALGNALVADAMENGSPYYNPALAPRATSQNLQASAALMSFDRELQFLQFATPLEPNAGVAGGLIHAGVSNIDGRDNSGYRTQTYSTDEFAVFLAFGTHLSERLAAGIGLQLYRADMYEGLDAIHTLGIDVGVTYRANDALQIGLAVDDLLARYSWDTSTLYGSGGTTTSDRFPVRLRVGGAYRLAGGRAQVLAEYESSFASSEYRIRSVEIVGDAPQVVEQGERSSTYEGRLRLGAEYELSDVFTLRGGLDRLGTEAPSSLMPAAGFMISQPVGPLELNGEYAFVIEPYGTGSMHLITLRVFL